MQAFAASYRGRKAPRKILVYLGDQRLRTPDGIDVLPIVDFLEQVENDQLFG